MFRKGGMSKLRGAVAWLELVQLDSTQLFFVIGISFIAFRTDVSRDLELHVQIPSGEPYGSAVSAAADCELRSRGFEAG